jgi:tRNA threonylcarbamoyladenosine biosynthesis protein TsaB
MRPILGLDTGAAVAALALVMDGRVAAWSTTPATSHGAAVADAVDALLGSAGLRTRDLGAVAVGLGPGSYTGLRVGLSYAKGLAIASGCALVGVPSLDAAALAVVELDAATPGAMVCPVVDARRGEVYAALYRAEADRLEKLTDDLAVTLERLETRIEAGVVLVGDSKAREMADRLNSRGIGAEVLDIGSLESRGAMVAAIGAGRLARSEADRADALEPIYVRAPGAGFQPGPRAPFATATEAIWSAERKNLSGNI